MEISGRTALVTGASGGIGRATAMALARRGARVQVTGRDQQALETLAKTCDAAIFRADLSQPGDVERLAEWSGPVDLLVNNAGFGIGQQFVGGDLAREQSAIDVMVTAVMRLTIRMES